MMDKGGELGWWMGDCPTVLPEEAKVYALGIHGTQESSTQEAQGTGVIPLRLSPRYCPRGWEINPSHRRTQATTKPRDTRLMDATVIIMMKKILEDYLDFPHHATPPPIPHTNTVCKLITSLAGGCIQFLLRQHLLENETKELNIMGICFILAICIKKSIHQKVWRRSFNQNRILIKVP